jgi:glycosyltransferase involved in cell wall biosynthesis
VSRTIPRVLVDLSAALKEQAGIPRVARQLAWLLSGSPAIETAALIQSIHWGTQADALTQPAPSPQSLLDDATFLSDALDAPRSPVFAPRRWIDRILRRRFSREAYPLIAMQPQLWDEMLWENYLAPSLPASCRSLFERCRFFRTPLVRREVTIRRRGGWPAPRLDTSGFDFVVFQGPSDIAVAPGTVKIIRFHDVVPLLRLDTQPTEPGRIADYYRLLDASARDSHFVCVSESTRDELVSIRPELAPRTSVIPNSLSPQPPLPGREAKSGGYFLAVGTVEPRKNYRRLLDGFRSYRRAVADPRPLVLVANAGWRSKPVMREIRAAIREGWLTWFKGVSPDRLADLYADAHALVAASVHEGFGYPPLEAAVQGTPSVLSDLKVFRGHFGDAAEYFDPHDPASLSQALLRLDGARREELSPKVRKVAQGFHADVELGQWRELFARLGARQA